MLTVFLLLISPGRVQCVRSGIRTPAGQHYGAGRRKRHFEVSVDSTPAPTNYMINMFCPLIAHLPPLLPDFDFQSSATQFQLHASHFPALSIFKLIK